MSMAAADSFRQFRVPQASGNAIVVPPITQIESELRSFVAEQALGGLEFCGLPLASVRCEARREVMQLAVGYTSAYRNVPSGLLKRCDTSPIILSGHQPELYHPAFGSRTFCSRDWLRSRVPLRSIFWLITICVAAQRFVFRRERSTVALALFPLSTIGHRTAYRGNFAV